VVGSLTGQLPPRTSLFADQPRGLLTLPVGGLCKCVPCVCACVCGATVSWLPSPRFRPPPPPP
jgi:hypothetical protein